jgi:hypothetical protein
MVHGTNESWAYAATIAVASSAWPASTLGASALGSTALRPSALSSTVLLLVVVLLVWLPGILLLARCATSAATPSAISAGMLRFVWSFIHFRAVPAFYGLRFE